MRRFLLTVVAFLILITRLHGQWEILNQGTIGSLNAIDFVSENVGWIVGDEGTLLKTEDGGQTWRSLPPCGNWNIRIIDFINESVGWAAADDWTIDNGVILKTIDGGLTWQIQKVITDLSNNSLSSIFVVDKNIVYALVNGYPDRTKILKTLDGGVNWEDIAPNNTSRNFYSVWFVNSDTGFVAGSFYESDYSYALFLKTMDGGKTWTEKISDESVAIDDLKFINDSTGFFINGWGQLYKTEDAFNTWPTTALLGINSYYALNKDTIYAIQKGSFWLVDCNLLKSEDGGLSWEQKFSINWEVDKIYFSNPQVGFLFGGAPYGGAIFRTVDSGDHWESQLQSYPFHDVHFIDKHTGFACGGLSEFHFANGNILVTHDGGRTWEATLSEGEVRTCQFINDQVGFAFSTGGGYRDDPAIYKTVDGGKSWIHSYPFDGYDLFFINEKTGWAAGRYYTGDSSGAGIITTIDQGENWELVWKYPDRNEVHYTLHSIQFMDSTTAWAVGENGLIVMCTDGQNWEHRSNITTLPLNKVCFADKQNGLIAGGYLNDEGFQTILFKTTDGGVTWEKVPDFQYLISDLYFHDTQHGWAIGCGKSGKGVIVETQDGGDHWAIQVDNLISSLNALSYRDNYLWAVGDYGLVLRIMIDCTTWIDERHCSSSYHLTCKLSQNYPNPFNPSTTIEFALPRSAFVTLKVYNLLGKEVATLIVEKRSAGIHRFNWDGSGLASGVYLYRLEAGDIVQTKKLILIR